MAPQSEPDFFDLHASFCRVFSDAKRLKIMWHLADQECSVGELAEHLEVSLQNVSQHLRIMREKGAVKSRREGQTIYYSITNRKFLEGAQLIREGLREECERRWNLE